MASHKFSLFLEGGRLSTSVIFASTPRLHAAKKGGQNLSVSDAVSLDSLAHDFVRRSSFFSRQIRS